MIAHTQRRSLSAVMAGSLAVALVAILSACSATDTPQASPTPDGPSPTPTEAAAELPAPVVTVSQSDALASDGVTITVTGEGFAAYPPGTDAARRPLAGKFGGVYVVFGRFADDWQPSEGAPSSARVGLETYWLVYAADLETIGGADLGGAVMNEDGSFTIDITISANHRNDPGTGNYGIYTYSGGGAEFAPFETFTPLSFE